MNFRTIIQYYKGSYGYNAEHHSEEKLHILHLNEICFLEFDSRHYKIAGSGSFEEIESI